jgi:hypothetical protein
MCNFQRTRISGGAKNAYAMFEESRLVIYDGLDVNAYLNIPTPNFYIRLTADGNIIVTNGTTTVFDTKYGSNF